MHVRIMSDIHMGFTLGSGVTGSGFKKQKSERMGELGQEMEQLDVMQCGGWNDTTEMRNAVNIQQCTVGPQPNLTLLLGGGEIQKSLPEFSESSSFNI